MDNKEHNSMDTKDLSNNNMDRKFLYLNNNSKVLDRPQLSYQEVLHLKKLQKVKNQSKNQMKKVNE